MSADAPAYYHEPVSMPAAPRRAVLQTLSTQETVPVQRHTSGSHPAYKLSESAMQNEAQQVVQERMRSHGRPRDHLAPLEGAQNIAPTEKRAAPPVTKENVAHSSKKPQLPTPPRIIVDPEGNQYERHAMLGQGGFARVFHVTDRFGHDKAFKVIAKSAIMQSKKNRQKILAEIMIHKSLKHVHIVRFEDVFEDAENVYFALELCHNGRRGPYLESEARYFMVQILAGIQHMHNNSIIHRDLKLGNLMLDKDMRVKIGDFGLAALLKYPEERKKTVCGTPNYIAPEILYDQGEGHSFEVDIWSVGVILYTLLVGRPPFQTNNVQKIYDRIRRNEYEIPAEANVSPEAQSLIRQILSQRPSERPSLHEIMDHPWFQAGTVPLSVPSSAVYHQPYIPSLTEAESLRNFAQLKAEAQWLTEEEEAAQAIAQPPRSARQELTELEAAEEDRDRLDRESQQAINPGSPISTLLKVGRQPLVKTPALAPASMNVAPSAPMALAHKMSHLGLQDKENTHGASVPRATRHAPTPSTSSSRPLTSMELMVHYLSQALAHHDANIVEPMVPVDATGEAVTVPLPNVIDGEAGQLRLKPDAPRLFIISWLDHSEKYGLGYALCNGAVGVHFRDSTSMVLAPRRQAFDYVYNVRQRGATEQAARHDQLRRENYVMPASNASANDYAWLPRELVSKYKLLHFFESEIMERLYGADSPLTYVDEHATTNLGFVHKWYRCKQAIVFRLSNGTVQFNFYDHTKLFLSVDSLVISAIEPVDRTDGVPVLRTWTLSELIAIAHPQPQRAPLRASGPEEVALRA
ncbi:Cell cycle serine/threonine-protein kinase Cdc5/Msd2 [Malassezia pachydermatis]